MSWLQDSEHARSQEEEELLTSWKSLEQEALGLIGRWQVLEVDRVLTDTTHYLSHNGTYYRRLLDATSGFMGKDGNCVLRIERSKERFWDGGSFNEALASHLRRKRVSPDDVAYAFIARGVYRLKSATDIDERYRSVTYRRVFSIALTREHMIIYGEKKSRTSIPAADIESSDDLERNVDLFIASSYQTRSPGGGSQGRHTNAIDSDDIDSNIAQLMGEEDPRNVTSDLDLSYDGGQYYLEGGGQRQVLNEELWRRMEDEERDRVRYELERQSQQDPNFIWPVWIPKEDVYGPIRSQRSMNDQSFGLSPRFNSDSPLNEQQIREDRERFSPGDHASGAGRG